jgi:carboxypeptidase Taq
MINNIHAHGNLYDPADLIRKITGTDLTIKPFLDCLNQKFSNLYGF